MADVQQIEVAVGESDAFSGTPPLLDAAAKFVASQNLVVFMSAWHLMRSRGRRRLFDRVQQLLARNGCCAALHHDDSARVVGQLSRFFCCRSGSESGSEGCDHGVAGAGDIGGLVGAENWNINWFVLPVEGGHAIASASDDERLHFHALHELLTRSHNILPVVSDADAE